MGDLKKFMSKCGRYGLPGGPNEIKFSVEGYKSTSKDRFNPFNVIPSGDITMKGVNHPVYGEDELGNGQMMFPGNDYKFPGNMVTEIPMAQTGYTVQRDKTYVNLPIIPTQIFIEPDELVNPVAIHSRYAMDEINNPDNPGYRKPGQTSRKENLIYNREQKEFQKAIDFHKDWMNSPQYKKMLKLSLDDPWVIGEGDYKYNFYNDLRKSNLNKIPGLNVLKAQPEDKPDSGGWSWSRSGVIDVTPAGYDVEGLYRHEISHSVDKSPLTKKLSARLIPKKDVDLINSFKPKVEETKYDKEWIDYITKPTEVRARLNDIRGAAKALNIYDPFTKKVTPEIYKKLKETEFEKDSGWDPLKQLRDVYTDEQIIQLLNTISDTGESQGQEDLLQMAQSGYQVKPRKGSWKKQDGGTPKDYDAFLKYSETAPENRRPDASYEYGNPRQYDHYGMWDALGKPKDFEEALEMNPDWQPDPYDNMYHGYSVNPNTGVWLKPHIPGEHEPGSTAWMEYAGYHLNPDLYNKFSVVYDPELQRMKGIERKQNGGEPTYADSLAAYQWGLSEYLKRHPGADEQDYKDWDNPEQVRTYPWGVGHGLSDYEDEGIAMIEKFKVKPVTVVDDEPGTPVWREPVLNYLGNRVASRDEKRSESSLAREAQRDALTEEMKAAGFEGYSAREVLKSGSEAAKAWEEFKKSKEEPKQKILETPATPKKSLQKPKSFQDTEGNTYSKKLFPTRDDKDKHDYYRTDQYGIKKRITREEYLQAQGLSNLQNGAEVDPNTNPDKILTYANAASWFDNRAVYHDNPNYNDQIRKMVYSGKFGYNPATGVIHKLEKPTYVPKEIKDLSGAKPMPSNSLMNALGDITPYVKYPYSKTVGLDVPIEQQKKIKPQPSDKLGYTNAQEELITYKHNKDLINSTADFDMISHHNVSPKANDYIKEMLYTGGFGYNPKTGVLVRLGEEDQAIIDPEDLKYRSQEKFWNALTIDEQKDIANQVHKTEWDIYKKDRHLVPIDKTDAWNPHFGLYTPDGTIDTYDYAGKAVYMTDEEEDAYRKAMVNNNWQHVYQHPLWYAPGLIYTGFVAPGAGAVLGGFGTGASALQGDWEAVATDAALTMIPFSQIAKLPKKIFKNTKNVSKASPKAFSQFDDLTPYPQQVLNTGDDYKYLYRLQKKDFKEMSPSERITFKIKDAERRIKNFKKNKFLSKVGIKEKLNYDSLIRHQKEHIKRLKEGDVTFSKYYGNWWSDDLNYLLKEYLENTSGGFHRFPIGGTDLYRLKVPKSEFESFRVKNLLDKDPKLKYMSRSHSNEFIPPSNWKQYAEKFDNPYAPLSEPYISRKTIPPSKQDEIFESFLGPEGYSKAVDKRTTWFDREGNIIPKPIDPQKQGLTWWANPMSYFQSNLPKDVWWRKMGSRKGMESMTEHKGIVSPDGVGVDHLFFSRGNRPNENYRGIYAVSVDPNKTKSVSGWDRFWGPRGQHQGYSPVGYTQGETTVFNGPMQVGLEDVEGVLDALKTRGKNLDRQYIPTHQIMHPDNIEYHGTYNGRPIVEVKMPDGSSEMFYKSTDWSGKGVGGKWQVYGGHANIPNAKNWFIKDEGFKNYYGSSTYRSIANNLDDALSKKFDVPKNNLDEMLNFKNAQGSTDTFIPGQNKPIYKTIRKEGSSMSNVPLEDPGVEVWRRLPFSNSYTKVDKQKILSGDYSPIMKYADVSQSVAEKLVKFALWGSAAQGVGNELWGTPNDQTPLGEPLVPWWRLITTEQDGGAVDEEQSGLKNKLLQLEKNKKDLELWNKEWEAYLTNPGDLQEMTELLESKPAYKQKEIEKEINKLKSQLNTNNTSAYAIAAPQVAPTFFAG